MKRRRNRSGRGIQWWQIIGFLICLYYLAPSFSNMGRLLLHSVVQPVMETLQQGKQAEADEPLPADTKDIGKGNVSFVYFRDDKYSVDGSQAVGSAEAQEKGIFIMEQQYKEFDALAFPSYVITDSLGASCMAYDKSTILQMQEIHDASQSWCHEHMPSIVPAGTGEADAIRLCADWVADHMSYDDQALADESLSRAYQNAAIGFSSGKGVCTTYASMFNTMITWLPFHPESQTVDYETQNTVHIDTVLASNDLHAWSMLHIGSQWKQYDITYYDGHDLMRQPQYLDMQEAEQQDGDHEITSPSTLYYVNNAG